jgi:N-acetylmuramoyl-L-alanine amidase
VITPGQGLGTFPGGLQDAARTVVEWARAGWAADVFIELHTNAGARGVFCVYPQWGDDVDAMVRDELGPEIARRISVAAGLPLWDSGVMGERSTAVGAGGSRLGVFNATASIRSCRRLIVECGAHTDPRDLAIIQSPGFFERAAGAIAEALLSIPRGMKAPEVG